MDAKPLAACQIIRIVFEAFRGYMASRLEVSGDKWENKARIREAKLSGSEEPFTRPRMHPLQMAAHNVLENRFHAQMEHLFGPTMYYSVIKDEDVTMENNVLAFQLGSAIDASVRDIVTDENEQLPNLMFRLEHDAAVEEFIKAKPSCLQDPWSAAHMEMESKRPGGLLNNHAKQKRLQICRLAWMELCALTIVWRLGQHIFITPLCNRCWHLLSAVRLLVHSCHSLPHRRMHP